MLIESTISKGRQITIPAALMQRLKVQPGDKIVFNIDATDAVTVDRAKSRKEQILAVFDEIDKIKAEYDKTRTPEQKALLKMTKGWTTNQFHEYFDNLPENQTYTKEKYAL